MIQVSVRRTPPLATVLDEEDLLVLEREGVYSLYLNKGYVQAESTGGRKRYLARLLLGLERGDTRQVDHRDRNPLNNRRSNLRIVAGPAEQGQNLGACPDRRNAAERRSAFRGVGWDASRGKWQAIVGLNGRNHFLGRYASERDAADAASRFRAEHMPLSEDAR